MKQQNHVNGDEPRLGGDSSGPKSDRSKDETRLASVAACPLDYRSLHAEDLIRRNRPPYDRARAILSRADNLIAALVQDLPSDQQHAAVLIHRLRDDDDSVSGEV